MLPKRVVSVCVASLLFVILVRVAARIALGAPDVYCESAISFQPKTLLDGVEKSISEFFNLRHAPPPEPLATYSL